MTAIETSIELSPEVRRLAPNIGAIIGRFDSAIDDRLDLLNRSLDEKGKWHGTPPWHIFGPTDFHPDIEGDPYYLSQTVMQAAEDLITRDNDKRPRLALHVLDQAARWPNTAVTGKAYTGLAVKLATIGEGELAVGIALDDDRLFAHEPIRRLADIPEGSDGISLVTRYAARKLCRMAEIYYPVSKYANQTDPCYRTALLSQVDAHTEVLASQTIDTKLSEMFDDEVEIEMVLDDLRFARISLTNAGESLRVSRLNAIDPAISEMRRALNHWGLPNNK